MRRVLMAGLAAAGAFVIGPISQARAQDDSIRTPFDCSSFALREPRFGDDRARPRDLRDCACRLRQDILWVQEDIESSTKKEKAKAERAQRIVRTIADLERYRSEVQDAAPGPVRDAAVARMRAAFDTLAADLGINQMPATSARVTIATEVRGLIESFSKAGPCSSAEFSLKLATILGAPSSPAPGTEPVKGWQLVLPGRAVQQATTSGERALAAGDRVDYLLAAHDAYDHFKDWARLLANEPGPAWPSDHPSCARPDGTGVATVHEAMEDLKGDLHAIMNDLGLRRPMTGLLIQALGFTRASADGKKSDDQSAQLALVKFETRHWSLRDLVPSLPRKSEQLDVGVLGHFGLHPAFNMFVPETPTRSSTTTTIERRLGEDGVTREVTTVEGKSRTVCVTQPDGTAKCDEISKPALTPRFESALSWGLGVRGGLKLGGQAEISAILRYGQVFTQPKAATIDETEKAPAAASLLDASVANRHYREWGLRASLFSELGGLKGHHDLGVLRPLLEVELGRRNDYRFRGAFKEPPQVELFGERPEERNYLRMALSGLQVFGSDTPFELSIAVEREWKRHDKGLPEGTKVFIQGRLDVFGLVSGPKKGDKGK